MTKQTGEGERGDNQERSERWEEKGTQRKADGCKHRERERNEETRGQEPRELKENVMRQTVSVFLVPMHVHLRVCGWV